ncbi:MAG: UDP-N-acetylmuramate--L-alanine ligase [Flavitalea sp.]
MINLGTIQRIYFIGIGGIGMSALARYFLFHGKEVSGYDKTATALTGALIDEGIPVNFTDELAIAPKNVELVVYTPAVPSSHPQLRYYLANNYTVMKRSEVLGAITENTYNICVAGTHGKTTISTMVAHILRHSGYGCNAFLGGIAANYNSNYWSNERNTCVIEADEYDRSFLKLSPNIAVISAMDADHLDIYGTEKEMQDTFIQFSGRVKPGGELYYKKGIVRSDEFISPNKISYSVKDTTAQVYANNVRMVNGYYLFDVQLHEKLIDNCALNMGGLHNVENASVAIAVANKLGIDTESIKLAVEEFKGVKRRFEYVVKKKSLVYIDDYAHHPEELKALISSAKILFPDLVCTIIFQPHLFSRTKDLADGFAESLDLADEVILLPIYPARELPVEGVTSELISEKMKNKKIRILNKSEVVEYIRMFHALEGLLITAGAGDIDTLIEPVKEILNASL